MCEQNRILWNSAAEWVLSAALLVTGGFTWRCTWRSHLHTDLCPPAFPQTPALFHLVISCQATAFSPRDENVDPLHLYFLLRSLCKVSKAPGFSPRGHMWYKLHPCGATKPQLWKPMSYETLPCLPPRPIIQLGAGEEAVISSFLSPWAEMLMRPCSTSFPVSQRVFLCLCAPAKLEASLFAKVGCSPIR